MQNGHLWAGGGGESKDRGGSAMRARRPPGCSPPHQPALGRPPSSEARPAPCPARPCRLLRGRRGPSSGAVPRPARGLLAAPADAGPQEGEQSQCGRGRPAKLFSPPSSPPGPSEPSPAPPVASAEGSPSRPPLEMGATQRIDFSCTTPSTRRKAKSFEEQLIGGELPPANRKS